MIEAGAGRQGDRTGTTNWTSTVRRSRLEGGPRHNRATRKWSRAAMTPRIDPRHGPRVSTNCATTCSRTARSPITIEERHHARHFPRVAADARSLREERPAFHPVLAHQNGAGRCRHTSRCCSRTSSRSTTSCQEMLAISKDVEEAASATAEYLQRAGAGRHNLKATMLIEVPEDVAERQVGARAPARFNSEPSRRSRISRPCMTIANEDLDRENKEKTPRSISSASSSRPK